MTVSSYQFRIILCNVLHGASFDAVRTEVKYCPTIDDAPKLIEECPKDDFRIIVSCKKQDADQLEKLLADRPTAEIYVLDKNETKRTINGRIITASDENELLDSVLMDAAKLALNEFYDNKTPKDIDTRKKFHGIVKSLLEQLRPPLNQGH